MQLRWILWKFPNIIFEGYSTDYQFPAWLKDMVEDGIAITRVGSALFALSHMEEEMRYQTRWCEQTS